MREKSAALAGRVAAAVFAAVLAAGRAAALEPSPEGMDDRAVELRADRSLHGERTFLEVRLWRREKPSERPEEIRLRLWEDRSARRCFARVVAPKDAAGTAFLNLPPNLWRYDPGEGSARRVRPAEREQGLFESDFQIGDLMGPTSLMEDYSARLLGIDPGRDGSVDRRAYVLEYAGRSEAPGVFGRIVAWVDVEWGAPLRREFYDREGKLLRVIRFADIREVQGRRLPHVWTATVPDSHGRESRVYVERIAFDPSIAASTFTTRNLEPPE